MGTSRWSRDRFTIVAVFAGNFALNMLMSGPSRSERPPASFEQAPPLRDRLRGHVMVLADSIGERNLWRHEALVAAASYIEVVLREQGYEVCSQRFQTDSLRVRNLEVEIAGSTHSDEIVIIGAHYDSVIDSPGANDNASGVAGLLEIARLLARAQPTRTLRFVAFVNEEPPFFQTGHMGSRRYARRCRERGEDVGAMLSLETIGYYSTEKGSQHYPFPFSLFYPSTADFIGFVGNVSSRSLVRQVKSAFEKHSDFPCESTAVPGWMTGIGWSDHWAFWKEGYPAIMVTDTALFRYRYYHTHEDTPEKVDYASLARVVRGLAAVAAELAGIEMEEGGILQRKSSSD